MTLSSAVRSVREIRQVFVRSRLSSRSIAMTACGEILAVDLLVAEGRTSAILSSIVQDISRPRQYASESVAIRWCVALDGLTIEPGVATSPCSRYFSTSGGRLEVATGYDRSPSNRNITPNFAWQSRSALSIITLNTGASSPGELLTTFKISEVAVCCSSASCKLTFEPVGCRGLAGGRSFARSSRRPLSWPPSIADGRVTDRGVRAALRVIFAFRRLLHPRMNLPGRSIRAGRTRLNSNLSEFPRPMEQGPPVGPTRGGFEPDGTATNRIFIWSGYPERPTEIGSFA